MTDIEIGLIRELFAQNNVFGVGVADYNEVLPLIKCAAARFLPQNPVSVITALFPYYIGEYEERNISRYTLGIDYHTVVKCILQDISDKLSLAFPKYSFAAFCDISPINEVKAAYKSGLGFIGKNGTLINRDYGSYTFIGCIVTDMELIKSTPILEDCGKCEICIKSCVGNALGGTFIRERCVSFITQKKGELNEKESELVKKGGYLWGCDLCLDNCPRNKNAKLTPISKFYENINPIITMDNANDVIKDKALNYRGIKVILRNAKIIKGWHSGNT